MSLPAVGATFETTISRSLVQKGKHNLTTEESTKNNFNIDMYLDETSKNQQPVESLKINFGTCELTDHRSTCELTRQRTAQPATKRRKINISSSKIDSYFSGPSTSFSIDSESTFVNPAQNDKEASKDDKKTLGKQYLKDVST